MVADRKKSFVTPVPILSVTGTFRPAGSDCISESRAVRTDNISFSIEGYVLFLNEKVLYPVSAGDQHIKRRCSREWRDLL